ncbi:RNA polymerase subunit sigma-70 [Arsukibacterium ikkense]|uniref:RNA polymerase subunit sigma-70 n=1 Tax=Arsukibacterium ikkense TaxID=336831 RepID=A0A0M2V4J2_9GAMM|nr:biopolymer transporter ExbD [Arsukibacterium ikkense]KKO44083.1 RNA polymerase subunit sigma-70 [Arsukibacterium ikkense]
MKQSFRAKRMLKQNIRLAQSSKLNLVALMDIFTILVFFLMVNQSDVVVLPSNKEMSLPQSVSEQLPREQVLLTVTPNGVLLQGKQVWRGDWQQAAELWQEPLSVAVKQELQYLAGRAAPLNTEQQAVGRPITILADATTPYAVLRRLMAISAATEYRDVSLAVEQRSNALEATP